ncbi:hypothetical protein D049_3389B, partial [Vibrio parahaemolyticus VPTS-2010]
VDSSEACARISSASALSKSA